MQSTRRTQPLRPSTAPAKLFKGITQDSVLRKRSPAELFMCLRMWMREHRQKHEHLQDTLIALLLAAQTTTAEISVDAASERFEGAIEASHAVPNY